MSVRFEIRSFETRAGRHGALVVVPTEHIRSDARRLAQLRGRPGLGEIDAAVLRAGAAAEGKVSVCIFRGADGHGHGSWGFAPELRAEEAREMARLMLREHMLVYRGLLRRGVSLFIHCDFGPIEAEAFRMASDTLLADASRAAQSSVDPTAAAIAEADAWVLRNLVFFFTNRFEPLLERVLPEKFEMMERRMQRGRERVLALPVDPAEAQALAGVGRLADDGGL